MELSVLTCAVFVPDVSMHVYLGSISAVKHFAATGQAESLQTSLVL